MFLVAQLGGPASRVLAAGHLQPFRGLRAENYCADQTEGCLLHLKDIEVNENLSN